MSKADFSPTITAHLAAEILNKTLANIQLPENARKIEEARENVGNEMLKMMQFVFPVIMQLQLDVVKEYGFSDTREGIIKFSQILRNLEREDSEVARLHGLIKAYYLPPISLHTGTDVMEEKNSGS
ncbi:protein C10 [Cylas formicarius]|uniref:protein C10 n=1 Tax=Cylas formicarius TaxID=197179 RepID=UPI00295857CD|nr:protein C10 [Cylas formicarius]